MESPRDAHSLADDGTTRSPSLDAEALSLLRRVDDMVDSRWTLTVVGASLREAGADCVFPFALADTAGRSTR